MRKILFLLMMCMALGATAQKTTTANKTLKIYRAKLPIKRPYREAWNKGLFLTFKKGEVITESTASYYTIKNFNQTYYLYGAMDCDYSSALIPKTSVTTESYVTGPLPVSAIGGGCRMTDKEGNELHIFVAKRNGHRFHAEEYNKQAAATMNACSELCVITSKGQYGYTEYIMPIKNGIVQMPLLIENDWVNYRDDDDNIDYSRPSFNAHGDLAMDMYTNGDMPEWWESVCYIPSKKALYLGNGQFWELKPEEKPVAVEETVSVPTQTIVDSPVKLVEPTQDNNEVHMVVESNPQFPGGEMALMNYLSQNIKYPPMAQEKAIQGRVLVKFVVEKDGSIGDVSIERSPDESLSAEAIRLVKNMPKWKPGTIKGQPVRTQFSLPVMFRLG